MSKGGKDNRYFAADEFVKAAKATELLDKSDNAQEAIRLTEMNEKTKQLDIQKQMEELAIQKTQVQEQERRKTVEYENEMAKR